IAIDFIPNSLQALIILRAISPLFAIKMLEILVPNFCSPYYYRFMFPCFFHGLDSLLLAKASIARIIIGLVSIGSITKSIIPFSAAIYGLAYFSRYSLASFFFIAIASADPFKSLLCMMVIAASGPSTAISDVGQA